jgi:hypothetical protein
MIKFSSLNLNSDEQSVLKYISNKSEEFSGNDAIKIILQLMPQKSSDQIKDILRSLKTQNLIDYATPIATATTDFHFINAKITDSGEQSLSDISETYKEKSPLVNQNLEPIINKRNFD